MIQTRDSVSCIPWGPDGEAYRVGGLHDAVSRRAGSGASRKCNKLLVFLNSGSSLIISYLKRTFRYATLGRGESSRPNG